MTAVWYIAPCELVQPYRRFRGEYCPIMWAMEAMRLLKRGLPSARLLGAISKKAVTFMLAVTRTWNLTIHFTSFYVSAGLLKKKIFKEISVNTKLLTCIQKSYQVLKGLWDDNRPKTGEMFTCWNVGKGASLQDLQPSRSHSSKL
jgi:hypothetical protein